MTDLTDRSQLVSYLKSHGLWTKHGLGQNFLVDREALDKIVEAAEFAPSPTPSQKGGELVIEVGPGLGTLTQELVQKAGKVISVELDQKLAGLLKSNEELGTRDKGNIEIINDDILKINISELIGGKPYKVIANIPYYITSKIIQLFLTQERKPELIVLLVQKEVAERICAKPGQMSTLSISVQAYGEPEIVRIVPKESFFPSPKVDSAILKIKNVHSFCHPELVSGSQEKMLKQVQDDIINRDEKAFFRLIHIGFASKRKTLLNNLSAGFHLDKAATSSIITSSNINPNARAQDLGLNDWVRLSKAFSKY